MKPEEIEDAIIAIDKLGLNNIEPGQIYIETLAERPLHEEIQDAPDLELYGGADLQHSSPEERKKSVPKRQPTLVKEPLKTQPTK